LIPLVNGGQPEPPIDPAAIELGQTVSVTIDIPALLRSGAIDPATSRRTRLDQVQGLTSDANIAPLIGVISRSVDFALGFLDLPHFRVLILLSGADSISVAELVVALSLNAKSTLALLDRMEDCGWIYTATPGRGVTETVAITEQGRSLVEDVTRKRQREIDEILDRLSEADRSTIATAFSSFATAAHEPAIRRPKKGIAP